MDLNGDGAPDVALLTDLGWSLSVLFNRGDGTFASAVTWPLDGTWWWNSLVAADLDGDGALDLAAVDYNSGLVGVLLNDGFGAFGPRLDYATGTHPVFLAVADVDGDGAADLLVSNMDSYYGGALVTVLVNDGKGTFSAGGEVPSPLAESGGPMAVADLNGDGRDDVVVLSYAGDVVIVLLNDGDGSFEPGTVYDADSRPLGVVATDLNGDGRPDLAVLHETNVSGSGDFVGVFVNQGDGTFHARVDYAAAPFAGTMTAADMDGNGATDLVVTDWRSGTVSVLRNRCDATFAPRVPFDGGPFPTWAAAADLNGDGRPDLVVINSFDCLLTTLFGACD